MKATAPSTAFEAGLYELLAGRRADAGARADRPRRRRPDGCCCPTAARSSATSTAATALLDRLVAVVRQYAPAAGRPHRARRRSARAGRRGHAPGADARALRRGPRGGRRVCADAQRPARQGRRARARGRAARRCTGTGATASLTRPANRPSTTTTSTAATCSSPARRPHPRPASSTGATPWWPTRSPAPSCCARWCAGSSVSTRRPCRAPPSSTATWSRSTRWPRATSCVELVDVAGEVGKVARALVWARAVELAAT